ncbi:hypothetical protein, variant [Aphanomyces astaci]|nr:hypothetical protein, variant [Aphanomyces astaci]ETV81182.1 hypothetical protein, variant [Aphanomyces astaci]|eukprot:XP_009829040.1 hypothetical protein, variant [Aphanomyces astaci]
MSVFRWKGMLDVLDKEWMCDSLADDDISVPEELDATLDDDASTLRFGMLPVNGREPPERWNDLGLDLFGPPQVPP